MRKLLGVLLSLCLLPRGLFAQQTQLGGTVTDPTGAVIPAAPSRSSTPKPAPNAPPSRTPGPLRNGRRSLPGTYKLTAKAPGFTDVVVNDLRLLVNQPATLDVSSRRSGATKETVTVEAAAQQVNTTDASLGNAIGNTAIMELPFFARNITNLLAAQPGVTMFNSASNNGTPTRATVR